MTHWRCGRRSARLVTGQALRRRALHPRGTAGRDGAGAANLPCLTAMLAWLNSIYPVRIRSALALCVFGFALSLFSLLALGVGWLALLVSGRAGGGMLARPAAGAPLHPAQLPGHWPPAVCDGVHRPEIRQYFIESDNEAAPFSRAQRLAGVPARQGRPTSGRSAPSAGRERGTNGSTIRWRPTVRPRTISASPSCRAAARNPTRPAVQHLGDELWRPVGQRHPGAERRRQAGRLAPTTPARQRSRPTTAPMAAT